MTIEMTKAHMVAALADENNKVIALSGRWGTGKSHLWSEVQRESKDDKVKGAIYVSLFGLATMDQVKLKVVQSAVPVAAENPNLFEGVRKTIGATFKALEGLHKSFSALGALGELAMLLTPTILKNKVIVLDDIERKQDKLAVEEILGFIDEFTQRHGARFLLILNTDRLEDKPLWETLREKVIDIELKLETSPEEAFDIAIRLTPSVYAKNIKAAVLECGLTNIRIIQKVIRSVNRILGDRGHLSDALLARVIPSTVLLSAVHYRGIEDGPTIEYVLSAGSPKRWDRYFQQQKKEAEETEESKREARWKRLLDRMGIYNCDEYELLIVDFLESGLFETDAVAKIIDRYTNEEQSMVARAMTNKFLDDFIWDHRLTEEQLVEQAKALAPHAVQLDAFSLTNVCERIAELPGGQTISDAMIAAWIERFKTQEIELSDDDFPFRRTVPHPLIQAEFEAKRVHAQTRLSLYEVCEHVAKHSSWGTRHRLAMVSSTAEEFERLIKNLEISDLKLFFHEMMEFLTKKEVYGEDFGVGADRFAEACRNIANAPDTGRLGKLIKALFEDEKMSELLAPLSETEVPTHLG